MLRTVETGSSRLLAASALLSLTVTLTTAAQDDVPPPPQIIEPEGNDNRAEPQRTREVLLESRDVEPDAAPPSRRGAARPATRIPNSARLAPLPEDRRPDEIVVIGQTNEYALPDLGSRWRAAQEQAEGEARFETAWLPLYDPDAPVRQPNLFLLSPEAQRMGFIELFRVRFGRPPSEED